MTLAHQIAERIHALRYDDLSATALEWTNHAFIDTIACSLAGMAEPAPRILMTIPGIAEAPGPRRSGPPTGKPACWTRHWSTARRPTRWIMTTCPA